MARSRSSSSPSRKISSAPTFAHERRLASRFGGPIAGIDEAGRGPWAGPVVVAAVRFDPTDAPAGLNDSKKLSPARREALYEEILAHGDVAITMASPARIDSMNIRAATLWAMCAALRALAERPVAALFDGRDVPPDTPCPGEAIIGGDAASISIAAASIVAKVTRDRLMVRLSQEVPGYGFAQHKGYGTAAHHEALVRLGPSPHHRRSFAPIRALLAGTDLGK